MRDIKEIIGQKVAVHCTSKEEVAAISHLVVRNINSLNTSAEAIYNKYGNNTVFVFFAGSVGYGELCDFDESEGYTIIPASEFITDKPAGSDAKNVNIAMAEAPSASDDQPAMVSSIIVTSSPLTTDQRAMIAAAYIDYCESYDPSEAYQKALHVVAAFMELTK